MSLNIVAKILVSKSCDKNYVTNTWVLRYISHDQMLCNARDTIVTRLIVIWNVNYGRISSVTAKLIGLKSSNRVTGILLSILSIPIKLYRRRCFLVAFNCSVDVWNLKPQIKLLSLNLRLIWISQVLNEFLLKRF